MIPCGAIVFDWDGTLLDTVPAKVANAGRVFAEQVGADARAVEEAYRRHSGVPRRTLFGRIAYDLKIELDDPTYDRLSRAFSRLNIETYGRATPFPDAVETLNQLRSSGFRLAVSSSAVPAEVEQAAETLGLIGLFANVLGSRHGFAKGPEHLSYLGGRFGLRPDLLCMVGDEPADVEAGRAGNTRTVVKLGSLGRREAESLGADAVIEHLGDLPAIVELER